jgi:hypothetical protein
MFMTGVAVFNDVETKNLLRRKLKADTNVGIYVSILRDESDSLAT